MHLITLNRKYNNYYLLINLFGRELLRCYVYLPQYTPTILLTLYVMHNKIHWSIGTGEIIINQQAWSVPIHIWTTHSYYCNTQSYTACMVCKFTSFLLYLLSCWCISNVNNPKVGNVVFGSWHFRLVLWNWHSEN